MIWEQSMHKIWRGVRPEQVLVGEPGANRAQKHSGS